MSLPHPWSDGYVVAVAWDALFNYRHSWDRLEEVDATLSVEELDQLLDAVRAAGNEVGPETPPHLRHGDAVEAQVARLFALLERVRRAVKAAFVGAQFLPDQIWGTCRFPRSYLTLPSAALAPAQEVMIIHLGDLTPRSAGWQQRARLVDYPNLEVLKLFSMELGRHPFGIDLPRLARLQYLDLRGNVFDEVPLQALRCASLRYLALSDNPLTALPDLSALPRLEYLELPRRRIPQPQIAVLRRTRPELTIELS
jgi:hypothetical protein